MEHMKLRNRRRNKWWRKRRKTENKYKVSGRKKKMNIYNKEVEKWEGKRHWISENEKMQRKRKTNL